MADVTLEFHTLDASSASPAATAIIPMTRPIVYMPDVIRTVFGLDSGFGNIRVVSSRPVSATIRGYSPGGGGSYGFAFMGMPSSLSMGAPPMMMGGDADVYRHYVQGLLPEPQARVNFMVTNTGAATMTGVCEVLDSDGATPATGPASFRFAIQGYSGHQFNNMLAGVRSKFGDDTGLQLRITLDQGSTGSMMTMASVVDNATNDSYVVMGSMMSGSAGMMGH